MIIRSRSELLNSVWLRVVLLFLFLTPSIAFYAGIPAIRLDEVTLVALVGYVFINLAAGRKVKVAWGLRQTLLVSFSVFVLISFLVGLHLGYAASLGDLNQLVRLAKYVLIYTLALTVVQSSSDPEKEKLKVLTFFVICSVLLIPIVLQQYFNLFHLNELYVPKIAPTQYETLVDDYPHPRPVGMTGNPNQLGFAFSVASLISMYLLVTKPIKSRYVFVLALQILMILLTLSRSSLGALAIGMTYLIIMLVIQRGAILVGRLLRGSVLMGFVLILGGALFLNPEFYESVGARFSLGLSTDLDPSWQLRVIHWEENLALFKESPILGVGPLRRAGLEFAADNEWLLLLRSYGVLGTLFLVIVLLLPHFLSDRSDTKALVGAILISSAVYMIPGAVFHSLVLMPIVLIVMALEDTTSRVFALRI